MKEFSYSIDIKFRDADPAGILFFGRLLGFAHDAFEAFIQEAGYSWDDWFRSTEYMVPIRHSECDFFSPFFPGRRYRVKVGVAKLSESSFTTTYTFLGQDQQIHATAKIVQVFVDPKTKTKTKIPELGLQRLSPYLEKAP